MSSRDDDSTGLVLGVVFGVIALVVALVIGLGQYTASGWATNKPVPGATSADGASVKVEGGVVKFYFATGKSDIASGSNEALAEIVKAMAYGKKAVISGFHDSTGDAAINAELAKQRAFKVRDALVALGVSADKVELKKPEQTLANGPDSEARRVEVTAQN
jgi:outer membrane protein OmpA-like peptidoglycan-associated protein